MTEREIYEKFDNLSEDELNTKSSKFIYVKINVMTNIIKHCRGVKNKGIRVIYGFRKKLMIPGFEISKCPEHEVKSKIGTIFVNEKILEECSVKIYEIDPYFYEHYRKKIQTDENGIEYILFRTDRDLIFKEKRQKALEKKLYCKFIRINTSKENYDADYEASRMQVFISQFEKKNKIKSLEDEIKELKLQLIHQDV